MNLFEAKAIYDSKTGKFLEEFYINGESVDCDVYYFYLEREKDTEDKKLKNKEQETVKEVIKGTVKETVKENPYEYVDEDDICECDECKYKDKKKYDSCNDFCDCEDEDKIVEDEICIQDEECQGCNECIDCDEIECENQISSEKLEELRLITYFTDEVLKRNGCPECTFELLGDLYIKGKNIGWNNHKEFMRELMDEALEE